MQVYIKQYWPIFFSVATVLITFTTQWAVFSYRVSAIEARQDRQGDSITDIKTQLTTQAANYAELKAKLEGIGDNVNYIRTRIDSVTK